jgi:hypothetical protein
VLSLKRKVKAGYPKKTLIPEKSAVPPDINGATAVNNDCVLVTQSGILNFARESSTCVAENW